MLSGLPYIPEYITVHLGTPDSDTANVTVPFPEYIQNVASSEIYPTWPENSLRANIYVITTFALNRIYTEWYRSRGYDFDITNTTQYDQKYIHEREIFENIRYLVQELFNDYIVRQGYVEPMFTQFCNGTTVTCNGLSQWGTVTLANQGKTPYEILQYYYGDDINIVKNAEVKLVTQSYPGNIIKLGDAGSFVQVIQIQLNRISDNFPAIPKIPETDGIFGQETKDAIEVFQEVNNLEVTGEVDESVWYQLSYIYTSVKKLAELDSQGLRISEAQVSLGETLKVGMQGEAVENIQYYLAMISSYYSTISGVDITGYFGTETEESVKSFQSFFGLSATGVVDSATWQAMTRTYQSLLNSAFSVYDSENSAVLYPGTVFRQGMRDENIRILQKYLSKISQVYPAVSDVDITGYFGAMTKNSVISFQKYFGINPTGVVGAVTWNKIASVYSDLMYGMDKSEYQSPGYVVK
jgi:peptidoglycan hydrolase-like protein with peptidoglycan-binding domain